MLSLFIIYGCNVFHKEPAPPHIENPVEEPVTSEPFSLEHRTKKIAIRFNSSTLPEQTAFLEIIYDGKYEGYFSTADTIFLPREAGRRQLQVVLSDGNGDKIGEPRYYWITIP